MRIDDLIDLELHRHDWSTLKGPDGKPATDVPQLFLEVLRRSSDEADAEEMRRQATERQSNYTFFFKRLVHNLRLFTIGEYRTYETPQDWNSPYWRFESALVPGGEAACEAAIHIVSPMIAALLGCETGDPGNFQDQAFAILYRNTLPAEQAKEADPVSTSERQQWYEDPLLPVYLAIEQAARLGFWTLRREAVMWEERMADSRRSVNDYGQILHRLEPFWAENTSGLSALLKVETDELQRIAGEAGVTTASDLVDTLQRATALKSATAIAEFAKKFVDAESNVHALRPVASHVIRVALGALQNYELPAELRHHLLRLIAKLCRLENANDGAIEEQQLDDCRTQASFGLWTYYREAVKEPQNREIAMPLAKHLDPAIDRPPLIAQALQNQSEWRMTVRKSKGSGLIYD